MPKITTQTLSGAGDPSAPVGSKGWLDYVVNYAKSTARDVSAKCGDLQKILRTMQECDAHKAAGFVSFEAFIARRVGISAEQAKAVLDAKPSVKVAAVLAKAQHARAQAVEVRRGGDQRSEDTNRSNRTFDIQTSGTGSEYLLRRLAKTAPDFLDRYEAGEFKSVRAASIAAGHIKVATVLQRLLKLWEKATEADRRKFKQAI
jgi:hypothetical protein